MPLCIAFIRSLVCRQTFRDIRRYPGSHSRWRPPQYRTPSYSTGLQQSLQDEDTLSAIALKHKGNHDRYELPSKENVGISNIRRHKAPKRTPRRRRSNAARSGKRSLSLRKAWGERYRVYYSRRALVRKVRSSAPDTKIVYTAPSQRVAKRVRWRGRRSPTQTTARFRTSTGLSSRRAIRGRIWSTANPYSLARRFPFQANPEPTAQRWSNWERQYARIASFHATYRTKNENEKPHKPDFHLRTSSRAYYVSKKLKRGQTVLTATDLRSGESDVQPEDWEQVALNFLTYRPHRMVEFLLATNKLVCVQNRCYEDTLLQLARYFNYHKDTTRLQDVASAFCRMVEERPERELTFMNDFVAILLNACSMEQNIRLFDIVKDHRIHLHAYTWLRFTTYFADNDQFEKALHCLTRAHESGADLDSYAFRSNCTTVLRRSSTQSDGLRVTLRLVSTLADLGVKFNIHICNVIMLNAVEAGDLKTAFSVYHSLKERGLKPNENTFPILLKGWRLEIDDPRLLDEIIRDAIGHVNIRTNTRVAAEILRCLALHHSKHNSSTTLKTMVEAYAQFFDLEPLKLLGIPVSPTIKFRPADAISMPPTASALTLMMDVTIQHYISTATPNSIVHTKPIVELYTAWRTHVDNAAGTVNTLLATLATTDHVSNLFLCAFVQHPKTLIFAARVVRDMQRPLPPTALVRQCKPSVQTWSIFLHGFTRHKQMKLAEQVLSYMRKEGIEPNQVTWNTLISGYARAQDLQGTVDAVRQAERNGLVWDVWTHKGLRKLRDRRRLDEELRRERVVERLDFSGDLKAGLGQRFDLRDNKPEHDKLEGTMESSVEQSTSDNTHDPRDWARDATEQPAGEAKHGFGDSAADLAEQDAEVYRPVV